MVVIHASGDIPASLDTVWNVIANIDREPEFWHGTRSIRNISKTGNVIEREVVIAFILVNYECYKILRSI